MTAAEVFALLDVTLRVAATLSQQAREASIVGRPLTAEEQRAVTAALRDLARAAAKPLDDAIEAAP